MWQTPPIIKIYEAVGTVADGRLEISGNTAKCYSSSGNKYYDIEYDPTQNAIMSNDNGSFWKGYLGYPAISYLLIIGVLPYRAEMGELLKGIAWKDINQQYNNDFDKVLEIILDQLSPTDRTALEAYTAELLGGVELLKLKPLGKKKKPPSGY
jgi:hypothetical protein